MRKNKFTYKISFILVTLLLLSCKVNKEKETTQQVHSIPKFELIAETSNLVHCESIAFDPIRNVLYVSVQSEQMPNDGSIAKISLEGEIIKADFITGLNNPKGVAVSGNKLYVADITELVEIDLNTEKIIKKHQEKSAEFLNDVAIAESGEVYVSDMFTSSIFKLNNQGVFRNWFSSPELENPNGLLVLKNNMFIAAWGSFTDKTPANAPQGRFLQLDIATKQITKITTNPIGNLDGVQEYDKDHFLLSDWKKGTVLNVSKSGVSKLFLTTEQSVGDILYLPKKQLLALPIKNGNKILIYKVAN